MQTIEKSSYRRKMGYPTPRKSNQTSSQRHVVPFLQRKRQHRYAYLSDGDDDDDETGKEPPGFFANANNLPRFNRHRDDLSLIPMDKSLDAADDTLATSGCASPEKVSWSTRDLGLLFKHLNGSQPNIDGHYRSKNGRGYMPPSLSCRKDDKQLSPKSVKSEKSDSDYAPTEIESSEDESSVESRTRTPVLLKSRLVRFADEMGLPLEETTVFEDDDDERTRRLIILLLSPNQRKFEFVHVSYRVLERMTLSDIIEQLPDLATNEILAKQRYTGLCRVRFGYQELINLVAVQSCGLSQDEILIAIVDGYKGRDLVQVAMPIFSSRHIVRAVKLAKRSGRAVQALQSRAAMDHRLTTEAKKLEEKHPGHVEELPEFDDVAPTEYEAPESPDRADEEVVDNTDDDPDSSEELDGLVFPIPNPADVTDYEARSSQYVSSARFLNTSVAMTLALFVLSSNKSGR